MIVALDTTTPVCKLWLIRDQERLDYEWEAGRELADGLIGYLRSRLAEQGATWDDVQAIVACKGPGSFTGLRIGLTVLNTWADTKAIPIVGEVGDDWIDDGLRRIKEGESDGLVMPLYGREPNITKPRK
ncbi:MAG: tRNA (adenosine(37)-N6)-threonylcarbamoyltransferase complex dimerization subunit type 1 TsaB [Patescibacteria group bacterium]